MITAWCNSPWKRAFDLAGAVLLLVPLLPVMGAIAVVIRLTSPGPVLFRQGRPGRGAREFQIYKFRTMREEQGGQGPVLTRANDPRLTGIGRLLRRWKLDELPQLFNVLRGDMSFVGPRPQPTKLWAHFDEAPAVLSVRPGVTGAATLAYRNEEELLQPLSAEEVEAAYIRTLMPRKMQLDLQYLSRASFASDLGLIARTVACVFLKSAAGEAPRVAAPPAAARPQAEVRLGQRTSGSRAD
jgi:lipopolysaccharide/colanic/teichoic acid biosynthesis glycosyltransferase